MFLMSEVPLYVPQVRVDGVLPAGAIFRVTFPSVVLLNDAWSPPTCCVTAFAFGSAPPDFTHSAGTGGLITCTRAHNLREPGGAPPSFIS